MPNPKGGAALVDPEFDSHDPWRADEGMLSNFWLRLGREMRAYDYEICLRLV